MGSGTTPKIVYVRAPPSDDSTTSPEYRLQKALPPTPPLGSEHARPSILRTWLEEIVSIGIALAALSSLFAVLRQYDGKTSPHWPSVITLNTLLAVISTVMKACLAIVTSSGIGQLKWSYVSIDYRRLDMIATYDDASRGLLGSLVLLWKLHGQQGLASLGALITILLVATEPFQQAIVRYEQCTTTNLEERATIPRANDYLAIQGRFAGAGTTNIVHSVEAGVIAGFFNPRASPYADCRTGNCTWTSTYSTVGWCSACQDLTNQVVAQNQSVLHTDIWQNSNGSNTTSSYMTLNLTTSLPGSINLTNSWDPAIASLQQFAAVDRSPAASTPYQGQGVSLDFLMAGTTVNHRSLLNLGPQFNCSDSAYAQEWSCVGYGAARCSLYPCVKTLNASMQLGDLKETVIETSRAWGALSPNLTYAMVDTNCINDTERTLLSQSYNITQRFLPFNISFPYPTTSDQFPASMATKGCMYVSSAGLNNGMYAYLVQQFLGVVLATYDQNTVQAFLGSLFGRALYNYGDTDFARVDELFRNMSISLTNVARQEASPSRNQAAVGSVQALDTCVNVRWAWFSYSIALVGMTLLYLLLLVATVRSYRGWKSSILPLLFHGLEHKANVDERNVYNIKDMRLMAEAMSVKLADEDAHGLGLQVR